MNDRAAHFAVIGAGPAGCAAAIGLRRAGFEATVVERSAFPRVKVCGEFVSPAATPILESLVSARVLLQHGAERCTHFVLMQGERERVMPMPAPAWAVSRGLLDSLLLNEATKAGAAIRQPALVRGVVYGENGVELTLGNGTTVCADAVIHADGSGRHDPAGPIPVAPGIVGLKCHLDLPSADGDGVRIRCCAGAYIGTIRVENGLFTCALVARRRVVAAFKGDTDAMIGALWPGYRRAWRRSEWLACGVPRSGYLAPGHARSFRIGNAAAAVDPIGGEGIGLALWSGVRLAEACAAGLSSRGWDAWALRGVQHELARAYRERLRGRAPGCRVGAAMLMRPRLVRALWWTTARPEETLGRWYAMTGKERTARPGGPERSGAG